MNPGDVILIPLPQFGGGPPKLRSALVLVLLPGPFQNLLICGISTQLANLQPNWDEVIQSGDPDFASSRLRLTSAIRLSYLYAADRSELAGVIGHIDPARLQRLRQRLSDHLRP